MICQSEKANNMTTDILSMQRTCPSTAMLLFARNIPVLGAKLCILCHQFLWSNGDRSALVRVMAKLRTGNKTLTEPVMTMFDDA